MYNPAGVKTSPNFPVPTQMKAWVLGDPDQLHLLPVVYVTAHIIPSRYV